MTGSRRQQRNSGTFSYTNFFERGDVMGKSIGPLGNGFGPGFACIARGRVTYQYDSLNRLSRVTGPLPAAPPSATAPKAVRRRKKSK